MEIKTQYNEFWHKIDDAEFLLKEIDLMEILFASKIIIDGKMDFDLVKCVNHFIEKGLINWKNVKSNGVDLECNCDNKSKLPFEIKFALYNAVVEKGAMSPEKKKNL